MACSDCKQKPIAFVPFSKYLVSDSIITQLGSLAKALTLGIMNYMSIAL